VEENMSSASAVFSVERPKALPAILVGGLVAGGLDLGCAFFVYGARVPYVIAGGLLGRDAFHGGAGTYALGILLQFFIATSAAAVYYAASRKLEFLKEHFLVCGLFYGIAVYLVMNLIVLPLSALHSRGPFQLAGLIQGLLVHMCLIGLPISFSVRHYAKQRNASV
jgi:Na+/alanine symporter